MAAPKLKPNHKSALAASSYQSPFGSESYGPLKSAIPETVVAMGYDRQTAVEVGVNWADDHDPVGPLILLCRHILKALGALAFICALDAGVDSQRCDL